MKLIDYITIIRKIKIADASREMGRPRQNVACWCDGIVPRKPDMRIIVKWSNGAVQPNDFYDIEDLIPAPAQTTARRGASGLASRVEHGDSVLASQMPLFGSQRAAGAEGVAA